MNDVSWWGSGPLAGLVPSVAREGMFEDRRRGDGERVRKIDHKRSKLVRR